MKKHKKTKWQETFDTTAAIGIVVFITDVVAALFVPGVAGTIGYRAVLYLSWAMIGGGLFLGSSIFYKK